MKNNPIIQREDQSRRTDKYWVPIIGKTMDLLDCFSSASESLTLEEIVRLTRIPHTTAFRILHTLVIRDYLTQTGRHYRLTRMRKKLNFGFANLSTHISLACDIQTSLERATAAAGINLLVWDNNRNPDIAIKNAEEMATQKIDLAIEFQLSEQSSPIISDIFSRAGIPLLCVVNPHHGTVYFGVNNFRAGVSAGLALADHAARTWKSKPDAVVLLESPMAGRTDHSRMVGVIRGLEERLGPIPKDDLHHFDGGGEKSFSRTATANFLRGSRRRRKILIAGINDESALGAVEAITASRGSADVAVVGHGGSGEILRVIADRNSPCIGTVSFHAERYGQELLNFALPILQGKSAPTFHYMPHEFIGKKSLR